jgi:hypothetical protein
MIRKAILAGAAALAVAAGTALIASPAAAASYRFTFNGGPAYHAYPTYQPLRVPHLPPASIVWVPASVPDIRLG